MSDPIEERMARLRATLATTPHVSRMDRVREDAGHTGVFLGQLFTAFCWVWTRVIWPVLRWLTIPGRWFWRKYRRLWAFVVYHRSEGQLVFSKTRAGLMVIATWFFLWYMLWPMIDCAWDAVWYAATVHYDEHIYLNGSQELDSWTGSHNIEGCSELPCSDQDAMYFRTEGGLFNNLWSLAHHGTFFYPDVVASSVPYQTSKCRVTTYGFRWRLPLRIVNTYAYILSVTCEPLGENKR